MSNMQKAQYEALVELINEHNLLVGKINAATGDRDSLAESIRSSEKYASIVSQIEALENELDTAVEAEVEAALASVTDDTSGLQEEVKETKSTIASGIGYYKKLYKNDVAHLDDLPKIERLKGLRTGGGSGGKRIRGYSVTIETDEHIDQYENVSSAAKALGIPTATLQEQFFAVAGVEKLVDAPDNVSFKMKWTDTDEDGTDTEVVATITMERTGPSGPPAKAPEAEANAPVGDPFAVPSEDDLESI